MVFERKVLRKIFDPKKERGRTWRIKTNDEFSVDKKIQLDVTFVLFISLLIVAQHVSCNHVPIIRS